MARVSRFACEGRAQSMDVIKSMLYTYWAAASAAYGRLECRYPLLPEAGGATRIRTHDPTGERGTRQARGQVSKQTGSTNGLFGLHYGLFRPRLVHTVDGLFGLYCGWLRPRLVYTVDGLFGVCCGLFGSRLAYAIDPQEGSGHEEIKLDHGDENKETINEYDGYDSTPVPGVAPTRGMAPREPRCRRGCALHDGQKFEDTLNYWKDKTKDAIVSNEKIDPRPVERTIPSRGAAPYGRVLERAVRERSRRDQGACAPRHGATD